MKFRAAAFPVSVLAGCAVSCFLLTCPVLNAAAPAECPVTDYRVARDYYNSIVQSAEWRTSLDRRERGERLNLPEKMLCAMTTDALAEAVLDYPFFNDIYAFDDPQTGFAGLYATFNGFQALAERKDAGTVLLEKYCAETVMTADVPADIMGEDIFRLQKMEVLLAQPFLTDKLTAGEKQTLIRAGDEKYRAMLDSPVYSAFSYRTLFRLLRKNSTDPDILRLLDEQGF